MSGLTVKWMMQVLRMRKCPMLMISNRRGCRVPGFVSSLCSQSEWDSQVLRMERCPMLIISIKRGCLIPAVLSSLCLQRM